MGGTYKDVKRDVKDGKLDPSQLTPDSEDCQITGVHILRQTELKCDVVDETSQKWESSTTTSSQRERESVCV